MISEPINASPANFANETRASSSGDAALNVISLIASSTSGYSAITLWQSPKQKRASQTC